MNRQETRQKMFDKVAVHLVTQGTYAGILVSPGEIRCFYRADDGKRCAIGCLIPDELYHRRMERSSVSGILDCGDFNLDTVLKPEVVGRKFLAELQLVHDDEANWLNIRGALARFAKTYNLNLPKLPEPPQPEVAQ